jgi:hypothetical protein
MGGPFLSENTHMRKISQTHRLPDGRSIEVEAETLGKRLRLRARLVDTGGFVVEALSRTYPADAPNVISDFTAEFASVTGISLDRPLFPSDLSSLRCPAAPPHWQGAVVWGIAAGTPDAPHVTPIPPEPLTPALIAAADPCTPREVFRIAAVCVKGACRHWRDGRDGAEGDGRCSLVERVVDAFPPSELQPCGIRQVCRWFNQEGAQACRVCPGVATDTGELPQEAEAEGDVSFF